MRRLVLSLLLLAVGDTLAAERVTRWATPVKREGQAVWGLNFPTAAALGQIRQESSGDETVTAWDNGRGLAQFMDGTAIQVARQYPELGTPNPYNPTWAIRAMVRLDKHNFERVKGDTDCEKWAATLKGYNAGLGYVQRAQKRSTQPGKWFGLTEDINPGQSQKNFEYSRNYPRLILLKHQPLYKLLGGTICLENK